MHQTVEYAICNCGIADLLMPARHWHLRRQDHASDLITLLANFPEVTTAKQTEKT